MKKYLISIIISFSFIIVKAQDPIFDLSYQNRLLMNPAFCGNDGGGRFRINGFFHDQYINNRGTFNYKSVSIDYGICRSPLSVGLILLNETQGDGLLNTTAFSFILGGGGFQFSDFSSVSFGMQINGYNYSVDWSKYVFSDQLDPINGITQTSSNNSPNILSRNSIGLTGGGIYTYWNRKHTKVINLGVAVNHFILQPKIALLNSTREIDTRITFHLGLLFKENPNYIDWAKEITFRHDFQANYTTSIINCAVYLNSTLALGAGIRFNINQEVFSNSYKPIFEIRIMPKETYKISLSYGYNIASNSSGLGNAFELGIVFLPKAKFCNPIDVFRPDRAQNGGTSSYGKKGKGRFGKGRQECPVYSKDKIIPTF